MNPTNRSVSPMPDQHNSNTDRNSDKRDADKNKSASKKKQFLARGSGTAGGK